MSLAVKFSISIAQIQISLIALSLLISGDVLPGRGAQSTEGDSQLRDALFLIRDTCTRERDVRFLSLIKTTPKEVSIYLKTVVNTADETLTAVDRWQKADSSLRLTQNPLPLIEQKARKLFIGVARQQVIFGTKGPDYVRALLVDQIQESVYIGSLAQASSLVDTDPDRAKTLGQIARRWLKIRDNGYRLLGHSD